VLAALLVGLLWAAFSALAAESVGETSWDADCYEARPLWAVAQAVVAIVGIGAGARASWRLVRSGGCTAGLSVPIAVAAVALLVWAGIVFVPDGADVVLCPGQSPESL
jgi:hypothetical protein